MCGVFKCEFDCGGQVFHEIIHGLDLLRNDREDHEGVIHESPQEEDFPDKCLLDGFFVVAHE